VVATIQQYLGKINPILYADKGKELLAKYGSSDNIPAEEVVPKCLSEHTLVYDSTSETLEPVYFFILDTLADSMGLDVEKIFDNFSSSPGSGHFSELNQKATIMQQQGTKILADINTVLRSVLNIIYDLRDFKMRLQYYDDLRDKEKSEGAMLALKQIWMDKVDIGKGNSSIKAMALGQAGYQTLIDAFLVVKDVKGVHKLDLNDRVRRMLTGRIEEFNVWLEGSERELKKRYNLERNYLKSQVNSLKLYSRWAKPHLKNASELEMKDMGRDPALVKAFNTIIFELTLMAKSSIDIKKAALAGDLPKDFSSHKFLKAVKRKYYNCVLADFKFVGIPQKVNQQHYAFGGRAEVKFRAYSLNEDELAKLDELINESDMEDVLKLIEGSTSTSLENMQDEINYFLEGLEDPVEKKSGSGDQSNPFKALFGGYSEKSKPKSKEKSSKIEKVVVGREEYIEKEYLRKFAAEEAEVKAFTIFDLYKKAHGWPSYT